MRSIAVASLLIVVVLGAVFASYFLSTRSADVVHIPKCNVQFSEEVGASARGLCLELVQISVSSSNPSDISVPVMIMNPGTTSTMDVLYLLSARSEGHRGPLPNVTSSEVPLTLSVPSGQLEPGKVSFSNASVVFQDTAVILYRYTVSAAADSNGYYAILPPYYYGIYPALAVGADPNGLNKSALSIWGFSGVIESQEFVVPSYIVGTGNLNVVNATVPMILNCPNPACVMISHSQN